MKRALIVGINYVGTGHELRGCLNDAHNMNVLLAGQYKFDEVKLVIEKEATTDGIKAGLEWLITGAKPGDVLVFHYSGHGSQLPSATEKDGYQEIICPIDLNWVDKVITDETLRKIFNRVPNGVNTTVILDCCHSGTGLNQDVSYSTSLEKLEAVTKVIVNTDPSRFLEPPEGLIAPEVDHVVDWTAERDINSGAMLIAACQAHQTSADAHIDGSYQGAATAGLIKILTIKPDSTYVQLTDDLTNFMVVNGFTQRPELDGWPGLYGQKFLQPLGAVLAEAAEAAVQELPPATPVQPSAPEPAPVTGTTSNAKNLTVIAVAAAIVLLALFVFWH